MKTTHHMFESLRQINQGHDFPLLGSKHRFSENMPMRLAKKAAKCQPASMHGMGRKPGWLCSLTLLMGQDVSHLVYPRLNIFSCWQSFIKGIAQQDSFRLDKLLRTCFGAVPVFAPGYG